MTELLWGARAGGTRGPKPALTLGRIATTAVEIADAEGFAAVSMQRVATELGFTKMALYRYLPGKTELVALMVEHALGAPPDLSDQAWRQGLRSWSEALLRAHLRHPWTLEAVLLPRPPGPNEVTWLEAAVARLDGTGLTGAERLDTVAVLTGQVRIIAQRARDPEASEHNFAVAMGEVLGAHGDRFPALVRTMTEAAADAGRDNAFAFGIERILDGLQTLISSRATTRAGRGGNPPRPGPASTVRYPG